jgi:hypothetical protein
VSLSPNTPPQLNRNNPYELDVNDMGVEMGRTEVHDMLTMIQSGNKQQGGECVCDICMCAYLLHVFTYMRAHSLRPAQMRQCLWHRGIRALPAGLVYPPRDPDAQGGTQRVCVVHECVCVCVSSSSNRMWSHEQGNFGSHVVYCIEDTALIPIAHPASIESTPNPDIPSGYSAKKLAGGLYMHVCVCVCGESTCIHARVCELCHIHRLVLIHPVLEARYKNLFSVLDLTKNFFFSYTYDLSRSLQFTMTQNKDGKAAPDSKYFWNHFLLEQFRTLVDNRAWGEQCVCACV